MPVLGPLKRNLVFTLGSNFYSCSAQDKNISPPPPPPPPPYFNQEDSPWIGFVLNENEAHGINKASSPNIEKHCSTVTVIDTG